VAGLHTAWRTSVGADVMLLTKRSLFDSATAYAQGGIAAALGAGDSPKLHSQDTLAAGAALCDEEAVRVLVEEGPARVRELQVAGADFDLTPNGALRLGREAAHSRRRIVHSHGDRTGAEVARTLVERVKESPRTRVLERARVLDLIVEDGRCAGVRASVAGDAVEIRADATVLATGGCGQVYRYTTNPVVATGDGYAIAHRAGVRLADMEFVQFHPTALDTPENPLALVSEAVRGEGAFLLNGKRNRVIVWLSWRLETSSRARSSPSANERARCFSTRGKWVSDSPNGSRASLHCARHVASIRAST
jgi:L-aspartate oxidase